jgi:two-component system response regulator NreC
MVAQPVHILIIEDHALVTESYKTILHSIEEQDFVVDVALNCDATLERLMAKSFNLILLDIQLPASSDRKFLDGEDLGIFIRKHQPEAKILVITAIAEPLRIESVFKYIDPEGFIIKSDVNSRDVRLAIQQLLRGRTFFSSSTNPYRRLPKSSRELIDDYDRKILYHLSLGEKTKDLQKFVPLSKRGIEERKVKLRDLFGIDKNSETNLIKEAKKRNII